MSLIAELKRRNVFRVGVAYAIVAWLLIEVASVVLPTFEAPPGPDSSLIRCLTEFLLSDIAKIQLIFPIRTPTATPTVTPTLSGQTRRIQGPDRKR